MEFNFCSRLQVAFTICSVIDDGTRMLSQASRTDPKYQNQGIMNSCRLWCRARTLERVPTVRSVISTIRDAEPVQKLMQRVPTYKLLTKRVWTPTFLVLTLVSLPIVLFHPGFSCCIGSSLGMSGRNTLIASTKNAFRSSEIRLNNNNNKNNTNNNNNTFI